MTASDTPTNYKELNHTHIKQPLNENAEQRHSMRVVFTILFIALLLAAIGYGVYAYMKMDNVPTMETGSVTQENTSAATEQAK